jgi:murein DD-endopeptidase MepM/ murein hydrolase activator NlpD
VTLPRSRREARLAGAISAPAAGDAAGTPSDSPTTASRPTGSTVGRRAARAAAGGEGDGTTVAPDAVAVAASTVAAVRPHAPKAGRRAAEKFSDEIERPAGGRRAIVSGATTALPIEESGSPASTAPPAGVAPHATSGNGEPATTESIDVEIVVAEVLDDSTSALASTPLVETAAIPVIETAAAILPAALAGDLQNPDSPAQRATPESKPVSRRTLRTAAIAPTDGDKSPGGAGDAEQAKPPTGRRSRRGLAKGAFSALALVFATGIAVATTMPAEALHAASENQHVSILAAERSSGETLPGQQLTTSADAAGASIARDGYSVRDVAALKAAGFRVADTFTNNPTGAIQWPFPVGVPISDGFGFRESPGGIGSTDHKGVDFAPGQGTPIQSIADGVVSSVQPYDNSGLGVHVIIDHVVDGQKVSSVYGHMLTGSIQVSEGQVVKVAQTVGLVGNTGASTGPHLHLEIRVDGVTPVDPFAWLQTHAV